VIHRELKLEGAMAKSKLVTRFILVADITVVALAKERLHGVSVVTHKAMALGERCEHVATCDGIPAAPHHQIEVARSMRGSDPAVDEVKIADPHGREGDNSRCDEAEAEEQELRLGQCSLVHLTRRS
jgi:hypothetical protein